MGILDSIVEWIATQVMNLLDLITGSVLGALGCDMSTFLRYFPAAETLYEIFVAIGVGFILLNLVWQLFRNFGLGLGLSAEDPVKLAIKSILFIFLALFADQIMVLVLGIVGTPYDWVVDTALPPIEFASFASVVTVLVGSLVSGSVSLIVLILVLIVAWNYIKLLFEAAERYILVGVLIYTAPVAFATGASENTSDALCYDTYPHPCVLRSSPLNDQHRLGCRFRSLFSKLLFLSQTRECYLMSSFHLLSGLGLSRWIAAILLLIRYLPV